MLSILEHRNKKVIEKLCDVNVANNMDCFIIYTKLIGNDHLKLHFNLSFKIYLVWLQLHLFSPLQNYSWSILLGKVGAGWIMCLVRKVPTTLENIVLRLDCLFSLSLEYTNGNTSNIILMDSVHKKSKHT